MQLWKIFADYNYRALWLAEEIEDIEERLRNLSASTWKPIHVCLDPRTTTNISDFPIFAGETVWSKHAVEALHPLIAENVEPLPLIFDEGDYYVINVINVLTCFDDSKSEYYKTEKGYARKKYFLEIDCVKGNHIFRLSDSISTVYVSDTFKSLVEEKGLKGFRFMTFDYEIV